MFPVVRASVSGLEAGQSYFVLLDIVLAEESRYKYQGKQWTAAGKAEPQLPARLYFHPDSPASGAHWMKHDISFHKVKLTNNNMDQQGHIVLTSMHKYHVRIHVVPAADVFSLQYVMANNLQTTVTFPDTKFLGVTAYQNERITQLKIDNNPFAKGFRENGHLRTGPAKRKSEDLSSSGSGAAGSESQRSRTDSSGSGSGSLASEDEDNDEVFTAEAAPVSQAQVTSSTCTEATEARVPLSPIKERSDLPSSTLKTEAPGSPAPSDKVAPIISRPFQFPPPASLCSTPPPPPPHLLYYQHLLAAASPLLPYLPPLYPAPAPQSPELPLSLLRLPPASPGPLPPSPGYLAPQLEYIARNLSLHRNQL